MNHERREAIARVLFIASVAFVLVVTTVPVLFVLAVMAEGD